MCESKQPGRSLKVTFVVRDETDDPSILDIVRRAIEDGLREPAIGTATSTTQQPPPPPEHRPSVDEKLETAAREAVEEVLAKVIEEFQAAGKEPSFDAAKWAEQLSKLWAVIRKGKAAGIDLCIIPDDPATPAEGA